MRPADVPVSEPFVADQQPAEAYAPAARRPRLRREPRDAVAAEPAVERIEIDRLPPSFASTVPPASDEAAPSGEEDAPRRRRTRRPRAEDEPAEA